MMTDTTAAINARTVSLVKLLNRDIVFAKHPGRTRTHPMIITFVRLVKRACKIEYESKLCPMILSNKSGATAPHTFSELLHY